MQERTKAAHKIAPPPAFPIIIGTLDAISAKLTAPVLLQMDNAIIIQHENYSTVAAGFLKPQGLT